MSEIKEEVQEQNTEQVSEVVTPTLPRYKTFERICDNPRCGKDFTAHRLSQRFCSDSCRSTGRSKKERGSAPVVESSKHILPTPTVTGLQPHLQMAFDILTKNSSTYEKWFIEEKRKREELEAEKQKLILQIRDIEQKQVLDGVEENKPSMFERVLNGIPSEWKEHVGPAIGQLAMALVSKVTPSIGGTDGQLDEAQGSLIAWLSSLPDPSRHAMMQILGALAQMPELQFNEVMPRIVNAITGGQNMRAQRNETMYGI